MERNDWHLQDSAAVLHSLKTDMYKGLDRAEVRKRSRRHGANRVWYVGRASAKEYALACLSDLATVLLVITAVFAAIFEESMSAVQICLLLVIGAVLRIAAYVKARRVLETAAEESMPVCNVLRDGKLQLIRAEAVTVGDIVFLEGGDMVPGDGRVVAGEDIAVSERGITGNRETVHKFDTVIHTDDEGSEVPAEYRSNILYAGSTVLWGQGRMVVTAVGEETLIVRKQGGIRIGSMDTLPLMERLNRWCRNSSLFMLACVMVITALALFLKQSFTQVFLVTMAMAVASMSEYLTTIAYILVAVAVRDAGFKKDRKEEKENRVHPKAAVITDSAVLEKLAHVDALVLSDMELFKSGEMSLYAYNIGAENRKWEQDGKDPALPILLRMLLSTVSGQQMHQSLAGAAITAMSDKYRQIQQAADQWTRTTGKQIDFDFRSLDHVSGKTGISGGLDTVLVQDKEDIWAVVSGGIREVMYCCSEYAEADGKGGFRHLPMTEEVRRKIFTSAAELAYMGASVIACARRRSPYTTLNRLSVLQSSMCFMGFAAIAEAPASETVEMVRRITEAGYAVAVLSEDTEHDLYYGHDIGLFDKHTKILSFGSGEGLSLAPGSRTIVEMPSVYSPSLGSNVNRSDIRYKRLKAVLKGGNTEKSGKTAVVCRNVLDARLLSLGDVKITAGSASHAVPQPLKAKADVVIYPRNRHGGFAEAVESISEAKRALANLWNAAVYLAMSQISRLTVLLLGLVPGGVIPSPEAVLLWGLLFDFAAVLAMSFVKAPADVLGFPEERLGLPDRNKVFWKALAAGAVWGILCGGVTIGVSFLPGAGDVTGTFLASMFLSQMVMACSVGQYGSLLKQKHFHTTYALLVLAEICCAWASVLKNPAAWYTYLFALIPPVVLFIMMEIIKARRKWKKEEKEEISPEEPDETSVPAEEEAAEKET